MTQNREFEFNDDDFRFIVNLVYKRVGIKLADHKKDMVYGRIARRLRELKYTQFKQYCDLLNSHDGDAEITNFINAITTNLTKFFREAHHFVDLQSYLDEHYQPTERNPAKTRLRIWSAGCSSGMEPYSIAMTVLGQLRNTEKYDIKILATDIDTNMLNQSSTGIYPAKVLENIPDHYHKRFTRKVKNEKDIEMCHMLPCLKSIISFKRLNLHEIWPMKNKFNIIFCRNVVIYFDKPTQKKLFNRFAEQLENDGKLYIGHSENLHNISDRFQLVEKSIYKKIK